MKRMTQYLLAILIAASVPHFVAEGQKVPQSIIAFERAWPDSLIGEGINVACLLETRSGTLLAGTAFYGMWKSSDVGLTWEKVTIEDDVVLDLLQARDGTIFSIGTDLYRSNDEGETWEKVNKNPSTGLPPNLFRGWTLAENQAGNLFLGVGEGAWKSVDSGRTWFAINEGLPKFQRLIPPFDSMQTNTRKLVCYGDTIFACTGGSDYYTGANGIYRSTNGGSSWHPWYDGIPKGHPIRSMTISEGILFAGGELYNIKTTIAQRGIWRSGNGGATWELSAPDREVWTLETGPGGAVYAGSGNWKGLCRSTDLGITWGQVGLDGYTIQSILFLSDTLLVVGTNDGVFKARIPSLLPNHSPILLYSPGDTVTYGGTFFKRTFFAFDTDGDPVTVALDSTKSPSWLKVDSVKNEVWGTVPYTLHDRTFQVCLVATDIHGATDSITSPEYRVDRVVKVDEETEIPKAFALSQNFPNPFNPTTTIEFQIPNRGMVNLTVYNVLGQVVGIIVSGELDAGTHRYTWSAEKSEPSGTYFYRLEANGFIQTNKMLLVR